MNWVLIAVGSIFLISVIVGIYRGAIKITVSLAATLLTFVLVYFLTPYVADGITSFTPIGGMIEKQVVKAMASHASAASNEQMEVAGINAGSVRSALSAAGITEEELNALGITIEDITEGRVTGDDLAQFGISGDLLKGLNISGEKIVESMDGVEIPRDIQIAAIQNADMPDVFKNLLLVNNNEEIYQRLGADGFVSYVAKYLTRLIINLIAFMLTLLVVTVILRAIIFALDIISNLPVLGFVNRLAGGVLGAVGALIIVWILFLIITMLYTTSIGKDIFEMIQEEPILSMIYENNPVLKLATIFR